MLLCAEKMPHFCLRKISSFYQMYTARKPSFVLCCRFGTQGHTKHAAPSSPSVMGSSSAFSTVRVTVFICALVLALSLWLQMRTHLFPGKCKVDILAMSSFYLNASEILQNREVSPILCPFRLELGLVHLISFLWLIPSFHYHWVPSRLCFLERTISHGNMAKKKKKVGIPWISW